MKILVVCQNYYPEPFRITDICETLVVQGHEVTVVTGLPNYPYGKIYSGYKKGRKRDEVINGVKIHRCFEIGRRKGVLFRFLNYYSFALSSSHYLRKKRGEFDVIFVNQLSPVMMARGAIVYKKKFKTKMILYCLDLWPESLLVGGIVRNSTIYKHYLRVSKKIYNEADKILISSKSFQSYFYNELGVIDKPICYLPQYAEDLFFKDAKSVKSTEKINLLFAGNIGAAQGIETIIEACRLTSDIENLHWQIVGDGSALEQCKDKVQCLKLKNITFHGYHKLEEMPKFYQEADAFIVTLKKDQVLSLTLPGKVQSYMAVGKPILVAADGETRRIIEEAQCGYCGEAENAEQLALNVRLFCTDLLGDKTRVLGENARKYYELNFSKEVFFDKLTNNFFDGCDE